MENRVLLCESLYFLFILWFPSFQNVDVIDNLNGLRLCLSCSILSRSKLKATKPRIFVKVASPDEAFSQEVCRWELPVRIAGWLRLSVSFFPCYVTTAILTKSMSVSVWRSGCVCVCASCLWALRRRRHASFPFDKPHGQHRTTFCHFSAFRTMPSLSRARCAERIFHLL